MPHAGRLLPTRQEPDGGVDPEELVAMVDWLEQKARASLDRVLDEQRDGIWKLNAKVATWRENAWQPR